TPHTSQHTAHTPTPTPTHMYTHTHTNTHAHAHTHRKRTCSSYILIIHTHSHTHTHTHTHTHRFVRREGVWLRNVTVERKLKNQDRKRACLANLQVISLTFTDTVSSRSD